MPENGFSLTVHSGIRTESKILSLQGIYGSKESGILAYSTQYVHPLYSGKKWLVQEIFF